MNAITFDVGGNRINQARKAKSKAKSKTKVPRKPQLRIRHQDWANIGVWSTIVVSAVLNVLANTAHAQADYWHRGSAILLGAFVPSLVFILSKLSGGQFRAGRRWQALLTGVVGLVLLWLSISHCAESIQALTGMAVNDAWMLAVAIDGGLVMCELDLVLA